ncbi:MAG: tRNA dihydrouridine synthase DusB [Candidatus Omnitrophica bacterium]|nr:tRNA dihydrouridine synthase DusB [Candidatus Omnitrophota bacterium]
MLKIGTLKLKSNLILAPMAGISDFPFRILNRRFGCELAFVEMINARSLGYRSKRTQKMLYSVPEDRPLGVQLLGCEEKYILRALDILSRYDFDILDFNAACPAKKVTRRGEGASLLKEPEELSKILKLVVKNSHVPVTLKIRTGWDRHSENSKVVAKLAEDAGISALFIHGRTKEDGYGGEVDYQAIREVKKSIGVPVIGSGNVFLAFGVKKMFEETGCDAVAIARGALGNPWIFKQSVELLKDGRIITKPARQDIKRVMTEHLDACVDFYGERGAVVIFRKFFSWYTKGFRGVRHLREKSSRVKTKKEMYQIIQDCSSPAKQKTPAESFPLRGSL